MIYISRLHTLIPRLFSKNASWRMLSSINTKPLENELKDFGHTPVMSEEILRALEPQNNQVIIDMTFGSGGHSRQLFNAANIKLYCLDRDPTAYQKALTFSKEAGDAVTPLLGKFSEIPSIFAEIGLKPNSVDAVVIDAGCSSMQMDSADRGFSISKNGPLDMRMDGNRYPDQATAAEVLNTLDVPSLAKIFKIYGEEKHSKKIAQALFDAKYLLASINTTHELAELVKSTIGSEQRYDKLQRPAHVATKVFQALRIFVNDELNELNYGLQMAHTYLKPGGKVAILTFHSLEDRIVKRQILGIDMDEPVSQSIRQKHKNATVFHSIGEINEILKKKWKPYYKEVITPSVEEVNSNPRSRSAKLRVAVKNVE